MEHGGEDSPASCLPHILPSPQGTSLPWAPCPTPHSQDGQRSRQEMAQKGPRTTQNKPLSFLPTEDPQDLTFI